MSDSEWKTLPSLGGADITLRQRRVNGGWLYHIETEVYNQADPSNPGIMLQKHEVNVVFVPDTSSAQTGPR